MCNRFHQSEKAMQHLKEIGVAVDLDITIPPPKIFPTGMKTARHAMALRRSREGNRPLTASPLEWGIHLQVPGKRPGTVLNRFVTNVRNLDSRFWKSMLASPERRCLIPFSHFAEPHPEGGKGDDGQPKQVWFSLPEQPVGMFAGLWRPITIPGASARTVDAFAFVTTDPNAFVRPWHPKAMPVILSPEQWDDWLEGEAEHARALVKPYAATLSLQVETPPV